MKIAIIGYGKMGHMIEEVALSRGHEIVCVIDTNPSQPLPPPSPQEREPRDGEKYYTPEKGFESEAFRSADVAIEFTTPATAEENIRKAWVQGVPVISGSTGWKPEELKIKNYKLTIEGNNVVITNEQGKVMLVWSSNFSVGVNIFFELNKLLAEKMAAQPQYTPNIKEIHHIHKLDKPSGTAKTLAEQISAMYEGRMYDVRREIPIESIREGEVPGTHEVQWDSEEDTIVITHIAKGRRGFALGAVLAAEEMER
ncbi:MAG: 4-hydroxy-tetrahydrodipicolinate reductase [Paludibacteraceae bacterium]|nr:4-hydroxy-tetrahydrodipicolinate reductase [Paludibacteraceae bacterium]